jgi:transposase
MRRQKTAEDIVVRLLKQKFTYQQLNDAGFSNYLISKVSKTLALTGIPPLPEKRGRPSKMTEQIQMFVLDSTLNNRRAPSATVADTIRTNLHISISETTIRRIRHQLHFHFKAPKVRQHLDSEQKQVRIDFASSVLNNQIHIRWIVFSDESRACLGPDNRLLWRRFADNDESVFSENTHFPPGLMVFGAIGKDFKSSLIILKGAINADRYIQILNDSRIFEQLDSQCRPGYYLFQQDGARCHTAAKTQKFLKKEQILLEHGHAIAQI